MALKIPGQKNVFPHSRAVDTGLGKERIGQATVIVSLDGTGDVDSIQEGIDLLPSTGGVVYIKEGTYNLTSTIIIKTSNTKILGTGNGTIIKNTTGTAIRSDGNSDLIFSDFKTDGGGNARVAITLETPSDNCIVKNCTFTNTTSRGISSGTCTNNKYVENDLEGSTGINLDASSDRNTIIGNIGQSSTINLEAASSNNIIVGNIINNITLAAAEACDKNLIVGNLINGAITDGGTNTLAANNLVF